MKLCKDCKHYQKVIVTYRWWGFKTNFTDHLCVRYNIPTTNVVDGSISIVTDQARDAVHERNLINNPAILNNTLCTYDGIYWEHRET